MLTNLLCEKIQRLTGRTSIRAWNPPSTFFFGALTSMSFNDFPFSFIVDTEGWYCVTNGNISFSSLLFCFRSLDSLLGILFLIEGFLSKIVGSLRLSRVFFLIWIIFSSKVVFEEFFRRILKASPLTNPFLTFGGWPEVKYCVCKKVYVCVKCVFASRIDFSLNLARLYTTVSKMQSQCQMFRPWIQ